MSPVVLAGAFVAMVLPSPIAATYCDTRVASLPALERADTKQMCVAVMSEFLATHDRVEGLKRLALLEAWLRARAEPLEPQPAPRDCEAALQRRRAEIERAASDELARRRARSAERYPAYPPPPRPVYHPRDGDLMNPFYRE